MVHRTHPDHRLFLQSPHGGSVTAGGIGISQDVDTPGSRQHPGIRTVERHAAGIAPCAYTGFSQIIPCRPHEVPYQIGELFHHLPVLINILGKGLGTENHPLRMPGSLFRIAPRRVIVACNVQNIQDRTHHSVHFFRIGRLIHAGAHYRSNDVEHQAGIFWLLVIFLLCFVHIVILALTLGIVRHEHQVHPSGDKAIGINLMDKLHNLFCRLHTLWLSRLGDLVSDGIENHAGMVKIPVHHGGSILLPALLKIHAIVILALAQIPHIKCLVHEIHAVIIAGFQHSTTGRIVGGAQGIEPPFLHDAHPPPLTFVIGSCT